MDQISYQASLTEAAFFIQEEAGIIRASGPDRYDFLQRQTTGDIKLLSPENSLLTVLTSPTARIIDVLYLIAFPDDQEGFIDIITLPGRGPNTANFLKSKIFFNDNVSILDLRQEHLQIDLLGAAASKVFESLLGERNMGEGEVYRAHLDDIPLHLLKHKKEAGLGYRFIFPREAREAVLSFLKEKNAVELSIEVFEIRRIEGGIPAAGKELTDAYTPLETNLRGAVSDSKGCYTGQEVIARQITYDKVTRRLAGLILSDTVTPGAEIRAEDRLVGTVTSAVLSPRYGPIALGIIKRPYFEEDTQLTVVDKGTQISASVAALPFVK